MTAPPPPPQPEPPPFTAACIQMTSSDVVEDNLHRAAALLAQAADGGAQLAVLPECFPLLSADETAKFAIAEEDGSGRVQEFLATCAQRHRLHLIGGTIPLHAPATAEGSPRTTASCLLYAPDGTRIARYDKMHLFQFQGNTRQYDETATIAPGAEPVCADTPLGRIALSVCYDLRFPELYRQLQPDIIAAPSAFTRTTGQAHWQLLLTARAVENLCHVIGAAQVGTHGGGRQTHGHSMVISPWGDILAHAQTEGDEVLLADIRAEERTHWRERLPALSNRRIF